MNVIEEWRELPLQRLLVLTGATPATIRKLEDKALITIAPEIDERDPYAKEEILPTQPLVLNAEQAKALERIKAAMAQKRAPGVPPGSPSLMTDDPSAPSDLCEVELWGDWIDSASVAS